VRRVRRVLRRDAQHFGYLVSFFLLLVVAVKCSVAFIHDGHFHNLSAMTPKTSYFKFHAGSNEGGEARLFVVTRRQDDDDYEWGLFMVPFLEFLLHYGEMKSSILIG